MTDILVQILIAAIPAIIAITLHEAAHGYAALALGDDTARRMGRLSLNPLRHVDRVGTLLLPGVLLLGQLLTLGRVVFLFGWAKPVPVSAWRFADPRRGMMIVAAAGPAMNFFLAWLGALAMHGTSALPDLPAEVIETMLTFFILANLVLGLFNLLPIPPLDGGRIVVGLLPERAAMAWAKLEGAGILIVLLLVFLMPRVLAEVGVTFDPVGRALNTVLPWSFGVIYRLAGHAV
ncbi:MAG: site-2 protease family protein [Gemmatimonadaceae bacterium]|nr:site-2 protease family protein [Acetobacteraceae bacterium]